MSLRVWLPLNGNLNNQGCDSTTFSGSVTYTDSRKLGKSLSGGTITVANTTLPTELTKTNIYSVTYQLKINTLKNTQLQEFGSGTGEQRGHQLTTAGYVQQAYSGSGQNFTDTTLTDLKQHHIALTVNGSLVSLYIDGIFKQSLTATKTSQIASNRFVINGANNFESYLNDFRVYDHCLSEKEVKEISKGLCLHQPCNNNGRGQANLVSNSKDNSWSAGSTTNYSFHIYNFAPTTTMPTGTYNFSADIEVTGGSYTKCTIIPYNNGTTTAQGTRVDANIVNGKINTTFQITGSSANNVLLYAGVAGSTANNSIRAKNVKVEYGTQKTPWCPNSSDTNYSIQGYNDTREIDTSGYGRHGTLASVFPTIQTGSPRYDCCYYYNGNVNNAHYNTTTELNYLDNFSWSIWVKTNFTGTVAQYIFTVGRVDAGGYGYGLACASATNCRVHFGTSTWQVAVTGGEWTHLAFTKSGNTIKLYKNGTLYSTNTFSGTAPTYSDGNGVGIGCFHYSSNIYPYYGNISDFRIYATALSDADVKDLYSTSASIANNGSLSCYELVEI